MPRLWISLRLMLPSVWIGLIIGLSFLETPLKFLAPGITTPLGLGIGRLGFIALSVAGWIILIVLTLIARARPREPKAGWLQIAAMTRPSSNGCRSSDRLRSGSYVGESLLG